MSATCQCDETGDNPKCFAHGDGSQWALRQQVNDLLRERNALKAENEALKDRVRVQNLEGINPFKITIREYDALQAKLSLYTSWQPSDPGTKEAMEYFAEKPDCRKYETLNRNIETVLNSYRAAMVRLEEAAKELDGLNRLYNGHSCMKRAEAAEAQVAALTALLASMTKESKRVDQWCERLAELRHNAVIETDSDALCDAIDEVLTAIWSDSKPGRKV